MSFKNIKRPLNKNELIIIVFSIILGVIFAVIDSLVSAYFSHDSGLKSQLFTNNPNEIWERSLVIIIVFINALIFIKMLRHNQRTSDNLHESRETFKNVFEFSPTGIVLADKKGNFFKANPSFLAITGYTEEELLKKNFRDITHPDDLGADLSLLQKLENNEINNFTMEKRYLHKNGSYVWVFLNASSIRNAAGEQLYYIAQIHTLSDRNESSFMDISGREKAIFEKNRAYQDINQIFNSIGIGMCLIDKDQNIARINDSFLKLFKKTREEVIGHKCFEIMHEIICNSDQCPLERILSGDKGCEFESHKRIDENTVLTFIVTADTFTSPDKGIQGIIMSFTDITEIRTLEAKIAEVSEHERQNLGQLLHDELGQLLTGLTFRIEALRSDIEEKAYPEAGDIGEISALMKKVQSHIRRIMIGLYPVNVKYDRLLVALQDMATETEKLFHVKCLVVIEGDVNITDDSETSQLFYIAKEAVNNAVKHSKATKIVITLSVRDNVLTLSIQNDTEIKDDLKIRAEGLGLRIMEYRAKLIDAGFEYSIEKGKFIVRVWKMKGKGGALKNGNRNN